MPRRNAAPEAPTPAAVVTSSARLAANRANALRSTGPATPEGRAASSLNATTHGMTSRALVRGESAEHFDAFRAAVVVDLGAVGPVETTLALRAGEVLWRLQRAGAAEAAVANFATERAEVEGVREGLAGSAGGIDGPPFSLRTCRTVAELDAAGRRACAAADAGALAIGTARLLPGERKPLHPEPPGVGAWLDFVRVLAGVGGIADVDVAMGTNETARGRVEAAATDAAKAATMRAIATDLARARTDGVDGAGLLRRARRLCMETGVRALTAAGDARQRAELARATAGLGEGVDQVRRHEAHLQRQLAATLAALRGVQGRRPVVG